MRTWTKSQTGDSCRTGDAEMYAYAWYDNSGVWFWRVYWKGFRVTDGTGCIDAAEARRAADHILDEIEAGNISPPWKQSFERQKLEERLLKAREKDTPLDVKPPWGWVP